MANSDVIVRIKADAQNYDANIAKARKQLDAFKKDNLSLGGIMKQSTSQLTAMAGQFMGVAAAVGAAKKVIGDMIAINKQFEQSSSNLAAVMGKSRDEITDLTSQAKQLGATTQYTANQILELQANLARLGFNENEILNSTKAVQAMATAMGADLGEAANLAGSALRGFGMNASEMERVASVLSVGTTKSALSFEKLATALPIVQTAAAKTGFTIEDTVAMLGKLTDNGINAASAATQLRKILNDSTTAGTKLATALGGPVKSFDELVVALDKASKAGQNHADSVALVNSKNATALDILRDMATQREVEVNGVKKQTSALQDLRDSITDCSEGMQAMQDEQLNTLQGSITILGSAWEGLMLTFSESNGVIKSVVDGLTALLGAWTSWRNRNAGGDAAIKEYELGMTEEQRKGVQETIKGYKAGGATDEQIIAQFTKEKEALEKERDAARALYDQLDEIKKLKGSEHDAAMTAWNKQFDAMFKNGKYNYNVRTDGNAPDYMLRQIAGMNDQIAVISFGISTLSPASTGKTAADSEKDEEDKSKSRIKVLKAQYEEQEKAQIAALDRQKMNEADYEAEVYKIKRETLQKIADLYQEETAEKARANAAISQLDIQYQGIQMRLANKGTNKTTRKGTTATGQSGYSDEGISALRSQINETMGKLQAGSKDYIVQAQNLVDLTAFENLLKTAVTNGIEIDPSMLEKYFEQIDEGAFKMQPAIDDSAWKEFVDELNKKLEELELPKIELDVKTGGVKELKKEIDGTTKNVEGAAQAFSALGSAMDSIENPGAKVAGLVAQAIGSIVAGYGSATAQASEYGPWAWIAFAITGLATMISMVAGVKQATAGAYANGGIIPGNSFSGDNQLAQVNAGELILSRSQQSNIANQLTNNNPMQNLQLSMEVNADKFLIGINNSNRMRGGSRGYYTNVH